MSQPAYRLPKKLTELATESSLFNGPRLRWSVLTQSERCICAAVIATPFWWMVSWTYTLLLITLGIIAYEIWTGGNLRLQRPGGLVLAAFASQIYRHASTIFHSEEVANSSFLSLFVSLCFCLIIWYAESRNVKVRLEVLAWAITVLVLQILFFWIVVQIAMRAPQYQPPRTLLGQILDKGERFIAGSGSANYLIPYWPDDKLPGGFVRFAFFFPVPEDFALFSCFVCLLALELKKRIWSIPLFVAGVLLLFLSGTRAAWLILPLVLLLRYLIVVGNLWGPALLFALIALISFISLSMPLMTNLINNTISQTSEITGNMRRDSTEVRHLIYQRTLEAIVSEPDKLLFGRGVPGRTVLPGYEPAKVGSHSFILGTLLYRQGLIGTAIFLWFWVSIILTLYRSRSVRPICSMLTIVFLSIAFATMDVPITLYLVMIVLFLETSAQKPKVLRSSYA